MKTTKRIQKERNFKVHCGGRKWVYFETLKAANDFCNEVLQRTKQVLAVLAVLRIPKINMPDHAGDEKHTIIGENILFVNIEHDQDAANPCEDMDGIGMIRSFSSRHINRIDVDEAKQLVDTDKDVVLLSYFEHGQSLWFVQGSQTPAGVEFQWDGTRFAGIWIPDDSVRESYTGQDGKTRREWMIEQAGSACKIYTQWANGDVYGYNVQVHKLRKEDDQPYTDFSDYRFTTGIFDESCWGYFGWDEVTAEALDQVRSALSELGFSKRAISKALPKEEVTQ